MFKKSKILLTSFFLALNCFSFSQTNLVPNPSFETYTTCPSGQNQVYQAVGWSSYRGTPEYYNKCATYPSGINVPSSGAGFQYANTGNGYLGFYTYFPPSLQNRESVGCLLNSTLTIGTKYFISLMVNLCSIDPSLGFNTATDHLGIRFFTVPCNLSAPTPTNNFAHFYSTSIVTDTLNWIKISGSFIADSLYQYLSVGNFYDNGITNKIYFDAAVNKAAYYYIDDVCVSTDSNYCANWTGIKEFKKSGFIVYPNPSDGKTLFFNQVLNKAEIYIIDVYGKTVKSLTVNSSDKIETDLPNGIYYLKVNDSGNIISGKLIVNTP